jgi:hypothetical protein
MRGLQERNRPPGRGKQTYSPNDPGRHFDNVSTFFCDRDEYRPASSWMISSAYQYLYYKGEWYIRVRSKYGGFLPTKGMIKIAYQTYIPLKLVLDDPHKYGF